MATAHKLVLQQYLLQLRATVQIETLERTEPHQSRIPKDFEQLHAKHWAAFCEDASVDDWPIFLRHNLSKLEQDQVLYLAFDAVLCDTLADEQLNEHFVRTQKALNLSTGHEMLLWLGPEVCRSSKCLHLIQDMVQSLVRISPNQGLPSPAVESSSAKSALQELRRQAVERAKREPGRPTPVPVLLDVVRSVNELTPPPPHTNGHHEPIQKWEGALAELVELPSMGAITKEMSPLACDMAAGLQMMAGALLVELKKNI